MASPKIRKLNKLLKLRRTAAATVPEEVTTSSPVVEVEEPVVEDPTPPVEKVTPTPRRGLRARKVKSTLETDE